MPFPFTIQACPRTEKRGPDGFLSTGGSSSLSRGVSGQGAPRRGSHPEDVFPVTPPMVGLRVCWVSKNERKP